MLDAGQVYRTAFWLTSLLWLVIGVLDLELVFRGEPTVSDFLRGNPSWFWATVLVLAAGVTLLYLHLYVFPEGF